jgi:hypothetical protein
MTIISEYRDKSFSKKGKLVYTLRCDTCQQEFSRHKNLGVLRARSNHYCSFECFKPAARAGETIDEKKKATNKERYGADYAFIAPDVAKASGIRAWSDASRKKRVKTLMERYGVEVATLVPSVRRAANMTFRTKPEIALHALLRSIFAEDDIETWVIVFNKSIDFYVKSIDTYIEMDGTYWHVIEDDIERVEASSGHNDICRAKKYRRDREIDVLFAQKGMRLVRITDKQMKSLDADGLRKLLALPQASTNV